MIREETLVRFGDATPTVPMVTVNRLHQPSIPLQPRPNGFPNLALLIFLIPGALDKLVSSYGTRYGVQDHGVKPCKPL